jgi:hypothetical protein
MSHACDCNVSSFELLRLDQPLLPLQFVEQHGGQDVRTHARGLAVLVRTTRLMSARVGMIAEERRWDEAADPPLNVVA